MTPIPYFDLYIPSKVADETIYFLLSEYLNALMILRLFLILRVVFNYSVYTDTYTKKLCQQYGFKTDMMFAFKSRLMN